MERKYMFLIFTCCIVLCTFYVASKLEIHSKVIQWTKSRLDCGCAAPHLETKKQLSFELAELYLQLKHAVTHKTPPSPKVLLTLKGIIGQLDPAHKLSQEDQEATDPGPTNSSVILDVCPEKYMGEKFGYPFFHKGWILTNCSNVKPLPKVLTILLNTMEYPEPMEKQVDVVLKGINVNYPNVKVLLAPKNSKIEETAKKYKNIDVIKVTKGSPLGKVWNQLINEVSTPYTLIARDVVHFTWVTRAERQVRMISTTEHVGVVGGSFRNLSGHWRVGCRQTKLFNYVLQYEEGYHYSRKSCMFCDDLEGPFVAKTDLLKTFKLSEKYSKEVIFEEFFIRVFTADHLIMNCPDAMYYTTDYSTEAKRKSKELWRPLATDWKLARIILPGGVKHAYTCKEISYKCDIGVTKYAALPICCLEQFGNTMKFVNDFCKKHEILYELDAGSVLGALKFEDYSPFDIDGDIILGSVNISVVQANAKLFKDNGFGLGGYQARAVNGKGEVTNSGYLSLYTPDLPVEIWGFEPMSCERHLPPDLRGPSQCTKVRINGHWTDSNFSPGLFSRNRYGPDVLKHSQTWRYVEGGLKSSWERYKPGKFLSCPKPDFHSCLSKFPADGNLAFRVP